MLTLSGIRTYHVLEYANEKGEKIEADIEFGKDYYPLVSKWREITRIAVLDATDEVKKELEPGDEGFDEYEEETWKRFCSEHLKMLKIKRG